MNLFASVHVRNQIFLYISDLIPNHDGEAGPEESIQEEIVPASNPDPSSEEPSPMHQMHLQGSHAEHYAFYHQQFEQQSRPGWFIHYLPCYFYLTYLNYLYF